MLMLVLLVLLEEHKHWLRLLLVDPTQRLVDVIAIAASDKNWNQAGDDAEPTAAAGDLGAGALTRGGMGVGTPRAKGRGQGNRKNYSKNTVTVQGRVSGKCTAGVGWRTASRPRSKLTRWVSLLGRGSSGRMERGIVRLELKKKLKAMPCVNMHMRAEARHFGWSTCRS